jgi:hypothetical protein
MISISRIQCCGRELWLVRRIGIMLGFEAETETFRVSCALARQFAVEEIPGIKLNGRLRRENLHYAAAFRFVHGRELYQAVAAAFQYPAVVVAAAGFDLLVFGFINPGTDLVGLRKSNGVPSTARSLPVGMSVVSTGTMLSDSIVTS